MLVSGDNAAVGFPVVYNHRMKTAAKIEPAGPMTVDQAVWTDPDRMSGTPCFRGSRLPVQQLFDWLADGVSLDEFVNEFDIDRDAASAVLMAAGSSFCIHTASDKDQRSQP